MKGIDSLLGGPIEFEIVNVDNREEIKNSLKTFRLNEVYQTHQDYVEELLKKVQIYNDGQLTEYLENFSKLFESKNEMLRTIFGNYVSEKELGKRPLAKLTKDLLDDLDMKIGDQYFIWETLCVVQKITKSKFLKMSRMLMTTVRSFGMQKICNGF